MNTNAIFTLLNDWRQLPAYQLERRLDIFFAIYLKQIIASKLDVEITTIIPEFPVKHASSNQSFKIDYLLYSKSSNTVYLLELKTDMESWSASQYENMQSAKSQGLPTILQGLLSIYSVTQKRRKYAYLLDKLVDIGWLQKTKSKVYEIAERLPTQIALIYLQPQHKMIEDTCVITFDDVSKVLEDTEGAGAFRQLLQNITQ